MYNYGYDYGYGYTDTNAAFSILGGFAAMAGTFMIVGLAISIIMIISLWKIFKKAGKNGWEAIIPIYNFIVLLQIVELPTWYIVLFIVPIANIYAMFKIYIELAHKFGKSTGFGVLTVFFSIICLPILAFGKNNVYNGNSYQETNNVSNTQFMTNNTPVYQTNDVNNNSMGTYQQPFTFNQNVNTDINNIQGINMNNNINPMPQPEINQPIFNNPIPQNVVPEQNNLNTMQNTNMFTYTPAAQPVDNTNNQINPLQNNPQQPVNSFNYSAPTPPVNPQPVNNVTEPNVEPQLNVIPGMMQTTGPVMPNQNNNNQNM